MKITGREEKAKGTFPLGISRPVHSRRGFAMLFAVLVSSVLLSIGLSIYNLTVKELVLSSSGRESQFAFYAADTGVECAVYWDFRGTDIFATSTSVNVPVPSNPNCVSTAAITQYLSFTNLSRTSNSAETEFKLTIPPGSASPYCAVVRVKKLTLNNLVTTRIYSYGYNTACDSDDPNMIERALRVCYGEDCDVIDD